MFFHSEIDKGFNPMINMPQQLTWSRNAVRMRNLALMFSLMSVFAVLAQFNWSWDAISQTPMAGYERILADCPPSAGMRQIRVFA